MSQILSRYKQLSNEFSSDVTVRKALRINTLKITEQELVVRLEEKGVTLEKIPHVPSGYFYESPFSLGASEEYLLGYIYLQEAASQLPVLVLLESLDLSKVKSPNILDMCAAPGSKTTQLAQLTDNKVTIVALDDNAPRIKVLKNNLERVGASSVIIYHKDAKYASDLGQKFDFVLLDAPCSGNFCVEPDFFQKRNVSDFKGQGKEQLRLLKEARRVLSLNGILVYSTCSLEPEENELVINEFLEEYDDMCLLPVSKDFGQDGLTLVFDKKLSSELSKTKRLWPHKTGMQGFFIAKLQKIN